jgi:hypothetical protein
MKKREITPTWVMGFTSKLQGAFHILIFSSETTGPIATKLWWNGPWMAPFQNCRRRFKCDLLSKYA